VLDFSIYQSQISCPGWPFPGPHSHRFESSFSEFDRFGGGCSFLRTKGGTWMFVWFRVRGSFDRAALEFDGPVSTLQIVFEVVPALSLSSSIALF